MFFLNGSIQVHSIGINWLNETLLDNDIERAIVEGNETDMLFLYNFLVILPLSL